MDPDPDLKFPKLECLTWPTCTRRFFGIGAAYPILPLPPFISSCKNLRRFRCESLSPNDLSLLLTECTQLKSLDIRAVDIEENMFETLKDPVKGRHAEMPYFKDSKCSLESLRINFLPGDGISNLVKANPGLKELRLLYDLHYDVLYYMYYNFNSLGSLRLRSLELSGLDFLLSDIQEMYATLASDSLLNKHLEEVKVAQSLGHSSDQSKNVELLVSLSRCRQLRDLHFESSDDFDIDGDHSHITVGPIFTPDRFPNLVKLHLPCMDLKGFAASDIFHLPLLDDLSVCGCHYFMAESDISKFAGKVIRSSPLLEMLELRMCSLDDRIFTALSKEIPENCLVKFVVRPDSYFDNIDQSDGCFGYIQEVERIAQSVGLNVKFFIPRDNCLYLNPENCIFHC